MEGLDIQILYTFENLQVRIMTLTWADIKNFSLGWSIGSMFKFVSVLDEDGMSRDSPNSS
jgi:hypothetical protein